MVAAGHRPRWLSVPCRVAPVVVPTTLPAGRRRVVIVRRHEQRVLRVELGQPDIHPSRVTGVAAADQPDGSGT
jgi:hypothetical protein